MQISKKARWDQIIDEFSKSKYGNKKSAEINLMTHWSLGIVKRYEYLIQVTVWVD